MLLQQIGVYRHDIETMQTKLDQMSVVDSKPAVIKHIEKPETTDDGFWFKSRIEALESTNKDILEKLEMAHAKIAEKEESLAKLSSQIIVIDEDKLDSSKKAAERLAFLESQYVVVESENRLLLNENKKLKEDLEHLSKINESIAENFEVKIDSLTEWKVAHEIMSAEKDQQLLQLQAYEGMSIQFDEIKKSLIQKDADLTLCNNQIFLFNKEAEELHARIGVLSLENVQFSVTNRDLTDKVVLLETTLASREKQFLSDVRRLSVEIEGLKSNASMFEANLHQKSLEALEHQRYVSSHCVL